MREVRCGSNIDACCFRCLLNKTINKKNIILDGEILIVKKKKVLKKHL